MTHNLNGALWSADELGALRVLAKDGMDKFEIADIVKRSPNAVYLKARKLKIRFPRADGDSKVRPFSADEDKTIRDMAAAGYKPTTIAMRLRRGYRGVRRRANIMGLRFAAVALRFSDPSYKGWGEDREAQASEMWRNGASASSIAKALGGGITRSAVIGKMNRLGLRRFKASERKGKVPQAPKRLTKPKDKRGNFVMKDIRHWHTSTPKKPQALPEANGVAAIAIADLEPHHCRWVIGDPSEVGSFAPLFCGEKRHQHLPYCPAHCARAYDRVAHIRRLPVYSIWRSTY